ncbi:phosphatidylinositol N-acetylglucosaminyltransferase subunit H isoform X6 [Dromaius novaehollandiae]|uniref:phosphatidylinositol N-acetylglucosaminyltransferase subunit H isoform X6 n=1 Tax=Dromaius novaehollandiae TaxID=8790 RepID=UPI00311DD733
MEERRYRAVSGASVALRCRQHSASCRELAVRGPRLQLRSLTAVTSAVWLAAYGLFVLSEQKVIYYLCILLQDPQDPQGVSEVVPLFQLNSEQCYFHGNILILVNSTPPAKEVQKELCQFEIHYLPVILTFQVRVSMLLSFEGAVISNSVATHSLGLCSSKLCQSSKIPFIVSLSPGTLLR